MKRILAIGYLFIASGLFTTAHAQQVVDSPVKQKVIATRSNYTSAVADVDMYLVEKDEERAFKVFKVATTILDENIAELKEKVKASTEDGERLMLTEKLTAQQKHRAKLKELSLKLLQNRNLVNIEFKEALKNM